MKGPVVTVLLLGVLVTVTGTLVLQLAASDRTDAEPRVAAPPSDSAELRARLDELAEENRALRDRLAMLEQRPAAEVRAPADGYATREELAALRDELSALLEAPPRTADGAEPAALREQVAEALSAIRKEERIDAVRTQQEKRTARIEEDLTRLEEWLELTPSQVKGMRSALLAQYDREDEVRRLWEDGADDEYLGELKQEGVQAFREDVSRVLDVQQQETFWERIGQRGK